MESTVQLYRQGKGSQICFQGQVTKVEDLIPTNQKWIWMNQHTKFYLHSTQLYTTCVARFLRGRTTFR